MSDAGTRAERSAREPVVVPMGTRKLVRVALVFAGVAAFGAALWLPPSERLGRFVAETRVIGGLALALGLPVTGWIALRLLRSEPGLVIDDEGFVDRSSFLSAGRVAWSEVASIEGTTFYSGRYLSIDLRDPERFARRSGALVRLACAVNDLYERAPIQISAGALAIGHDELERLFVERFERWTAAHAAEAR